MIEQRQYAGEGLSLVYDEGEWVIGIKNYKTANDISALGTLERHNLTDESFVLLEGSCTLLTFDEEHSSLTYCSMEPGSVYTISRGIWHTTVMRRETKMILIERSGTTLANSDLLDLPMEKIREAQQRLTP
ncbi:MAG: hypothetical protein JXK93_09220 [Sphaerochaetaceae bacterium]|nr:hypothetical protein [Sphaerochaetaceae bacterium]